MIVVLKEKNNVIIAQTLASLKRTEMAPEDFLLEENLPMWKVEQKDLIIVGEGDMVFNDLIRFAPEIFEGKITLNKLATKIVPKIKQLASELNLLNKNEEFPGHLIIAQKSDAFLICPNGLIIPVENLETIGWYSDVIKGSISRYKHLKAKDRIIQSFKDTVFALGSYANELIIIDTATQKPKLLKIN